VGDFELSGSGGAGLAAFAARLERLASGAAKPAMHKAVADAVKDMVVNEFRTGTDPYGNAWKATIAGNPPLIGPSKDLSTSVGTIITSDGFIIMVSDWKAIFHQGGTKRGIPARPMLPTRSAMPSKWRTAIKDAFNIYMQNAIGASSS